MEYSVRRLFLWRISFVGLVARSGRGNPGRLGQPVGAPRRGLDHPSKLLKINARRPVSRVLSPPSRTMDDHSSGTPVAGRLTRPTRATTRKHARPRSSEEGPACRPYAVLLPVGFAVPDPSPDPRCALTAPFHPYRSMPCGDRRSALCGTFPGVAPAGRYPAPCFRGARTFLPAVSRRAAIQPSGTALGSGPRQRRQSLWDQSISASTAASRAAVPGSPAPSMRAGRK